MGFVIGATRDYRAMRAFLHRFGIERTMSKLSVSSKIGDNIAYATDDPGMIELDQMAKRFHGDIEAVDVEVSNGVQAWVSVSRIISIINCTTDLILARHTLTCSSLPALFYACPRKFLWKVFSTQVLPFGVWLDGLGYDEAFRQRYLTPLLSILFVTKTGLYAQSTAFVAAMFHRNKMLDLKHAHPAWVIKG